MTSRYTTILAVWAAMFLWAGPLPAGDVILAESPASPTPALRHRDRAVTSGDFKPLAKDNPGTEVERANAGPVRFGDGQPGARPPADGAINQGYRHGSGIQKPVNPAGQNTIDSSVIRQVVQELRLERTDRALRVWRQALLAMAQKGQAPPRTDIDNAIDTILKQAYPQRALPESPDGKDRLKTADQSDDGQMAVVDMQKAMQQQQQRQQALSKLSKQFQDTATAVIRNTR